jgi:1,4-alpha-glucan branching enzyme
MKKNIHVSTIKSPVKPASIHFEYINSNATAVYIAGDFNNSHPVVSEMHYRGNGRWVKELDLIPARYEYRFVVDGNWVEDAACPESTPNPYGGKNSVRTVPATPVN